MRISEGSGHSALIAFWPCTLAGLVVLLAWDASGLDLALARAMAPDHQFFLRDNWLLTGPLHQWMRRLALAFAAWLALGIWWPVGVLRRLPRPARLTWAISASAAALAISALKYASSTSCPWDLAEFGGTGIYLSHWAWGLSDGGPGHCFPAGHASIGFAFFGGFFALRQVSRSLAAGCLLAVLAAGVGLGLAQQLRGAHFMSHTLWTAWFCWVTAWLAQVATELGWPEGAGILAG